MYVIYFPLGDQLGNISRIPCVLVRLIVKPLSAGTVKISPRASNIARLPLGEISALSIKSATFLKYGKTFGLS